MFSKTVVIVLSFLALEVNSNAAVGLERFKGKVAIVTGCSSGMGFDITIALLKAGINVVGIARREGYGQAITNALPKENSDKLGLFFEQRCDITDEVKLLKIFKWINDDLGGISIMINNAGIIKRATLIGGSSEHWKAIWDLNVLALSVCTREAINSMDTHGLSAGGHIIHMSSIAAYSMVTAMGHKMYNATKMAVKTLADGLRHELQLRQSKIKVSCICPGLVDTNIFYEEEQLRAMYPPEFFLKPATVANAVLFVLDTPPEVLVAELLMVATGVPIQDHSVAFAPYDI